MDENNETLTKKEKADDAAKKLYELGTRVLVKNDSIKRDWKISPVLNSVSQKIISSKSGQKTMTRMGKLVFGDPLTKRMLVKNYDKINKIHSIANPMLGGKNKDTVPVSRQNNKYNNLDSYDDVNNNEIKGSGVVKGLWKKLPIKVKLTLLCIGISFCFDIIFLVILITPLMTLGIIDIEGIGSSGGNISSGPTSEGFTSISDSTSYWWPVDGDNSIITSPYGQRLHPIQKVWKMHNGIDIAISGGASPGVINILASNSGIVTKIITGCPTTNSDNDKSDNNCGGGYGNYIIVKHNDEQSTLYAHLYSINVSQGSRVNKGQIIGTMGSSGNSTGTHLHFEVRVNGNRQNPINFVSITNKKP